MRRGAVGRRRLCALEPQGTRAAAAWLERFERFWEARLDALEQALASSGTRDATDWRQTGPIERVWAFLNPAELRFEGRVGGPARERSAGDATPLPDATLMAWEPPRRLVFTMAADPAASAQGVRHSQRVTTTLEPKDATTRLRFDYTFADVAEARARGSGPWRPRAVRGAQGSSVCMIGRAGPEVS